MKQVFKVVIGVAAALAAVFYIGALFLPERVAASRSIEIAAQPEAVWPFIADLNQFNLWSPWSRRDPGMTLTITGPPATVGHGMSWSSVVQGDGTLTLIELQEPNYLVTDLDFGPEGAATARFEIAPSAGGSSVTWGFESDLEGPMQRWFGLILPDMIGADYEEGLANLKAAVEGQ
ncbi:MAG: SRPBCC family protein [Pseudomonadota bacterium]